MIYSQATVGRLFIARWSYERWFDGFIGGGKPKGGWFREADG